MNAESQKFDAQIKSIQAQLNKLPEGKLLCTRNASRYKWYQSDGKNHLYIPKKNRHLAEQLAVKRYLTQLYNDLLQEKKAIDAYLQKHSPGQAEQMLTETSEYSNLLSTYFKPLSQELLDWANSPYEQNPYHPEHRVHKTSSHHLVRSKSEAMIDMALHLHRIPFRYESALQLGPATLYPDFTIRHPKTGKTFYWEHFGIMDETFYNHKVGPTLQLYISNGIIPSIHLITTYETKDSPLNPDKIERIIREYFL